jgi:hypothetical protein
MVCLAYVFRLFTHCFKFLQGSRLQKTAAVFVIACLLELYAELGVG